MLNDTSPPPGRRAVTPRSVDPTLIYDGACDFCTRWVERVKRWDAGNRIALLTLQDPSALELSGRSTEELMMAMHLVLPDGRVFAGADAARELFAFIPFGWVPRAIFRIPGAMPVARKAYAMVAGRRYRLGCGGEHCGIKGNTAAD
jgi:predicted DCC family thiol-disulfide oxidoreductase YuxK